MKFTNVFIMIGDIKIECESVEIDYKAMQSSICRTCEYKEKCSDIRNCKRFEKII